MTGAPPPQKQAPYDYFRESTPRVLRWAPSALWYGYEDDDAEPLDCFHRNVDPFPGIPRRGGSPGLRRAVRGEGLDGSGWPVKALDRHAAYDIASDGSTDSEIAKRIAQLSKATGDKAASLYLEIAQLALSAASMCTVDETERAEHIDEARCMAQDALSTEPG